MATFHLQISTPDCLVFDGQAERIILRTVNGDVCILAHHIDYAAPLGIGAGSVTDAQGVTRRAAVNGGMLSVAFFVATQAGSVFDTLIFCGVILLAPAGIILINYMLCEMFLYGYVFNMDMGLIFALSPITLGLTDFFEALFGGGSWEPDKWATLIWLALDVMIFAGAAAAYRRRPSERAESPSRSGPISVLVRLLALTIACPPLGVLFSYGVTEEESVFHILMGTVIAAVLLFFVMEAVLNRGTKGILKAAPLCLALTVAVTGYTGVMANGGFGYETYLPPVEQVQHLTLNYRGRFDDVNFSPISTEDKRVEEDKYGREQITYNYGILDSVDLEQDETLAIAQQLQVTIVRQYREERAQEQAGGTVAVVEVATEPVPIVYDYEYDRQYSYGNTYNIFTFDYTMEDGSTVRRRYRAELTPEVQELLGKLSASREMNEKCNPLQSTTAQDYNSITVDGWLGLESMTFDGKADMEKLLAALRSDVERESWAEYQNPDKEVLARVDLDSAWERRDNKAPIEKDFFDDCAIYVTADYTNTLAALKQLGCGGIMEEHPEELKEVYLFALDYLLGYESDLALLTTGWYSSEDRAMVEEWKKEMPEYMLLKEGQTARDMAGLARHVVSSGEDTMLIGMVFEDSEGRVSTPMLTSLREMTEAGYKDLVYELEHLYDNKY